MFAVLKIMSPIAVLTFAAVALGGCIVAPAPYYGDGYYTAPPSVYVGPGYYSGPRYRYWRGGGGWHGGGGHHWH